MSTYAWDDEEFEPIARRDKKRSFESRRRTLQRRAIRWEKFGDDLRTVGR